jgi:hypothetical protein
MNVPTMIFREEFKPLDRVVKQIFVELCQYALRFKLDGLIPLGNQHADLVIHKKLGGERNEITDALPILLEFHSEGKPLLSLVSSLGFKFLKINHWTDLNWQSVGGSL